MKERPVKPSSSRHTLVLLRRFMRYFWPHKGKVAIGCLAMVAGLALSLAQPIISKKIIDDALMARNVRLLNVLGAVFLVVAVLSYICSTARQYYFTVVQQRVMTNVRRRLVEHILRLPMAFHDQQNPGYLMARADADVGNLAGVMTDKYVQALVDLLTLFGASAMLLALNWRLALLSMTALPLFTWSLVHFGDRMRRLSHENQEAHAIVAARLQDVFHSAYIIKVFARELGEVRLLIRDMNTFVRSTMRMAVLNMVCNLSMGCAATLAPLAIIWYGGYQVASGDLSIGSLFAFNMYVVYLFSPLRNIYSTVQSMQASVASLQRVYELMDRPGEQLSSDAPTPSANRVARTGVESACGSIEFRDVWFSYRRGQPVLKGLSFAIEPHTTVALVGASGAGKSTIFNLLLRLYDWDNGEVRLEGMDLKEWDSRSLRRVIRIVPQDPFLFNRSIVDNIRFGACDATMEEVRRSARQAHVNDVVNALPEGYDSRIGQRGTMLSAGERQRLSIARALVSNPRVLLLDEATAFLDANTEAEVQEAIRNSVRGRTCLIIAHRLATVVDADRIIVLNDGGVVDHGTHRQLYSRCGLYAGLCDKQFRATEARLDERCIVEARPRIGVGIV